MKSATTTTKTKRTSGENWTENHLHSKPRHAPLITTTVLLEWQTQRFLWTNLVTASRPIATFLFFSFDRKTTFACWNYIKQNCQATWMPHGIVCFASWGKSCVACGGVIFLIFCSDNAATIFEASCRAFQYEKLLIKIKFQWKRSHVTSRDAEESLT